MYDSNWHNPVVSVNFVFSYLERNTWRRSVHEIQSAVFDPTHFESFYWSFIIIVGQHLTLFPDECLWKEKDPAGFGNEELIFCSTRNKHSENCEHPNAPQLNLSPMNSVASVSWHSLNCLTSFCFTHAEEHKDRICLWQESTPTFLSYVLTSVFSALPPSSDTKTLAYIAVRYTELQTQLLLWEEGGWGGWNPRLRLEPNKLVVSQVDCSCPFKLQLQDNIICGGSSTQRLSFTWKSKSRGCGCGGGGGQRRFAVCCLGWLSSLVGGAWYGMWL